MLVWVSILGAAVRVATAEETSSVDDPMILAALESYLKQATYPFPIPPPEERARLLEGKVLKERLKEATGDRALGMVISTLPMQDLWLGSLDPHFNNVPNVYATFLPPPADAIHRWYGFVDLPRPFADRHFLITTNLNRAMAQSSGGLMWERTWHLEADGVNIMEPMVVAGQVTGVDAEAFEHAIYTPVNHGSWIFLRLDPAHVLVGYSCATVIGGDIPDGLVTQHILMGLDELLQTVVTRATTMGDHYRGDHPVLIGGDGRMIPVPP